MQQKAPRGMSPQEPEQPDQEDTTEDADVTNSEPTAGSHAAEPLPDSTTQAMVEAINQRMPFGKYQGERLLEIPEPYLVWFKQRGFPAGKLGTQMALVYEIRLNGLEKLVRPLLVNG